MASENINSDRLADRRWYDAATKPDTAALPGRQGIAAVTETEHKQLMYKINHLPRKTLGFRTPKRYPLMAELR